jgi:long-chain acyl-CoA synthetase
MTMGLNDFTFYDLINRNATIFPDEPAWFEVDTGAALTFKEYQDQVRRLACGLQQVGIAQGDRIGVLGKNSLEYFLLYGAASALGLIVLPINWRLSSGEAVFNLNDGEPRLAFVDQEYQTMIKDAQAQMPSIQSYYNLKGGQGQFREWQTLLQNDGAVQAADVRTDDGFVIIHTAAVAGRPRGALLSHGNVLCADMHLNNCFHLQETDVHLNLLPLFHVGGLFMATGSFHAGALNINMSKFDAIVAAELIQSKKVSLLFDFPPILGSILNAAQEHGKDLASLRSVIGLGTPEDIDRYHKLSGGTYYCMYGQTETSCLATMGPYRDQPGSAGKTIPLADIRLVDDNDDTVAVGQVGEIAMKGPMVFKGYWGLPEDTTHTFRGGWHHTGDLGRFDDRGFLWYAGRKADKELIKPGGENVYPAEVEKAILQHPAVAQTVVFGVPDPKWKEGIKAVCLLKPGQTLEANTLIRFVGEKIASYKKPQYVAFVQEMPVLKDGLPDRRKVKELYGGPQ